MKYYLGILIAVFIGLFIFLVYPVTEQPDIIKFLILSQSLFILYIAVVYLAKRLNLNFSTNKNMFIGLVIASVLLRFIISYGSVSQTYLSDDVYRYIWEGKLVSHAYNPYLNSPLEMKSSGLVDDSIYPNINHPNLPTIYPPLSQYLFTLSYFIGGDSIIGFKIISLLFELISMLFMFFLIKKFKLPDWIYLVYIFSPLVLIEFIFSNHLDILGFPIFLLLILILKNQKKQPLLAGLLLGLCILSKLYLLFFLPFIFFEYKGKEKLFFLGALISTIIIFYLPFIFSGGFKLTGSLWRYLQTWQYNGSVFLLLKQIFSQEVARMISWSIFITAGLTLLIWRKTKHNIFIQMFIIFAVYIIISPAIFNWYLIWLIPFIIIFQNKSFLLLTGTIMLSYHVLIGYYDVGIWSDYPLLRVLTYVPFYLLLLFEIFVLFRKKKVLVS